MPRGGRIIRTRVACAFAPDARYILLPLSAMMTACLVWCPNYRLIDPTSLNPTMLFHYLELRRAPPPGGQTRFGPWM